MSIRPFLLATLTLLVANHVLLQGASAERLLVAGPQGSVFDSPLGQNGFLPITCQCSGPILSMAADRDRLYTADSLGQLLVHDRASGTLENVFALPHGPAKSIAAADGALFAATETGLVARVDPLTGEHQGTRVLPSGVRVLIAHRGFLFAAGGDGAIYRAPVAAGEFAYFTCFCFFDIQGLAAEEDKFVVADASGMIGIVDLASGIITNLIFVPQTNAIALHEGRLLAHVGGGVIRPYYLVDGTVLPGELQSPIAVNAMLVLGEDAPAPLAPRRLPAAK